MKKIMSIALAALFLLSICTYALAASTTYYYTLSNGVNGKVNTNKVVKEAEGNARNVVASLSRTLTIDDPVIMKVRYGANGNPVTDGCDVTSTRVYSMEYNRNEGGVVGKSYYMKMQNTTGSDPVTVYGNFTP